MAPSFHLRSKFLWGIKGGAKPPLQVARKDDAKSIVRNRATCWMAGAKRVAIQQAKLAYHP